MYQLMLESFIGLQKVGDLLYFKPCIPHEWKSFEMKYCYQTSLYQIRFEQQQVADASQIRITLDGNLLTEEYVAMKNDGLEHKVLVELLWSADAN
jgi:cellobiose phosphorylase